MLRSLLIRPLQAAQNGGLYPLIFKGRFVIQRSYPFTRLRHSGDFFFKNLAEQFTIIEGTSSRDESVRILSNAFREIINSKPDELESAVCLSSSQIAPVYEGKELRYRDMTFIHTLLKAAGVEEKTSVNIFHQFTRQHGDLGTAMRELYHLGHVYLPGTTGLTITDVHRGLYQLAIEEGIGSVVRKQDIARSLIQRCVSIDEVIFLARLIAHQSLRIGLGGKSVLASLALAVLPPLEGVKYADWIEAVHWSYSICPNIGSLVNRLVSCTFSGTVMSQADVDQLTQRLRSESVITAGIPVQPMAAYPASSVLEVMKRMMAYGWGDAACEFKYDGERVQIHVSDVQRWRDGDRSVGYIFSRNLERIDGRFDAAIDAVVRAANPLVKSVVMEGEVVACHQDTGKALPFQYLQRRDQPHSLCLFSFDLLCLNGQSHTDESFRFRRQLLRNNFEPLPSVFQYASTIDIQMENADETVQRKVQAIFQDSVNLGHEGLMVKALDESGYKPGCRSHTWLKLKHDYVARGEAVASDEAGNFLPDTVDLVPIGAFYGKGRRSGMYGSFLMACFNPATQTYQAIAKLGSGFTDAILKELHEKLQKINVLDVGSEKLKAPGVYELGKGKAFEADVWLEATEVWEVRAAQLTVSPSYKAAHELLTPQDFPQEIERSSREACQKKGLSLRFPRFIRQRSDKKTAQATTSEELVTMFRLVQRNMYNNSRNETTAK